MVSFHVYNAIDDVMCKKGPKLLIQCCLAIMLKKIVFIIVIGAVELAQATTACSAQSATDECTMAESVKNLADATKNLAKLAMRQGECSSLSSCSCENNTLIVKELMDEVKNNTILIKKLQEEVKLQR